MLRLVAPRTGQHPSRGPPPEARAKSPKRKAQRQDKQTRFALADQTFRRNLVNFPRNVGREEARKRASLLISARALPEPSRRSAERSSFCPQGLLVKPRDKRTNPLRHPCRTVKDIASEIRLIIETEKSLHPEEGAEFYFRGEGMNYAAEDNSELGTAFPCLLYQPRWHDAWRYERELYQEALRCRVVEFEHDHTMADRLARMQHYQLPTRFNDLSDNALQAAYFATGAGSFGGDREKSAPFDGWIRVVKIAKDKMKSFTSDIIVAISHLPLVDPDKIRLYDDFAKTDEEGKGLNVLRYEIMKERPAFGFEAERPIAARKLRHDIQQVWPFKPLLGNPRIQKQGGIFIAVGCSDGKRPIYPTYAPEDYDNPDAPSHGIKQVGAVRIAADAKQDIENELRYYGNRFIPIFQTRASTFAASSARSTRMCLCKFIGPSGADRLRG